MTEATEQVTNVADLEPSLRHGIIVPRKFAR